MKFQKIFISILFVYGGSQKNLQRKAMKEMLSGWDKQFPERVETIFTSLKNISPSQMADTQLFDFVGLSRSVADEPRTISEDAGLEILEK